MPRRPVSLTDRRQRSAPVTAEQPFRRADVERHIKGVSQWFEPGCVVLAVATIGGGHDVQRPEAPEASADDVEGPGPEELQDLMSRDRHD